MANTYKRLGINTFWVFIGNIGPRLVSFILMPLYTFWLNPEDFGILDIIVVYSTLIIPYVTLGLYEAVFVFPKGKSKEEQAIYFSSSLVLYLASYFTFILLFFLLGENTLKLLLPERLYDYRYLLLVIIFTQSLQRITQFFFRGIDRMKDFSVSGIIYAVIIFVVGISLVPRYGINGYWISLISADVLSVIYVACRIHIFDYLRFNCLFKSAIKEMLWYSVPLIPNATMWWIVNSINRPILVSSVGLDGVGLYSVAGKFPSILSALFAIFFSSFQISALEEFKSESFGSFYNKVFRLQLFFQILIVIFFELFGSLIFNLFIDEKYTSAVQYLPLFCCGVLMSNVAVYLGVCFTVIKKTKYMLYSAIIAAIVAITANCLLIPLWGIYGACISVILSQMSMLIYRYFASYKISKIDIDSDVFFQILLLVISLAAYYCIKTKWLANTVIISLLLAYMYFNRNEFKNVISLIKNKIGIKKSFRDDLLTDANSD